MNDIFLKALESFNLLEVLAVGVLMFYMYSRIGLKFEKIDTKFDKLDDNISKVDKRLCKMEGRLNSKSYCHLSNQGQKRKHHG